MSGYDTAEAERAGLWEQLDQMTTDAVVRLDRLIIGDDNYDHFQEVSAEIRRIEHEQNLEKYRAAVRISRRNRGETP